MRLTGLTTNYSSRQQLTSHIRSIAQVSFLRPTILTSPASPPAGSPGLGGSTAAGGGENNDRFESANDTGRTGGRDDQRGGAGEEGQTGAKREQGRIRG